MQTTRRHGWRRPSLWQGVGIGAAVIAAGLIAYPAVSTALHADSHTAAVTTNRPDPAATTAELGTTLTPTPPATGTPSATTATTAAAKTTATPTTTQRATRTPTPAKSTGAAGSAQVNAGSASAPLAGRLQPGQTRTGVATFYQGAQNTGACSFDPSPDHFTAAMNELDYEGSNACGAYIQVHGSNGATITVRVTNECPYPCRTGQLDLDPEAYKLLAPLQTGETPITWKLLSPSLSGTMSIRYKTGSSQWWCGIQVINHRNPVARLEVKTGGGWTALPRTSYNYFLSAHGAGCGGDIRITDIYGQTLDVGTFPVKADVTQPTSAQFARR
jgi:expansin (peptidoglycan-binding protein)